MASTPRAVVGVTGLAVMGSNLARNLASDGHVVAVHNRSPERTHALVDSHGSEGSFVPAKSLAGFVASLHRPRRIIVMVKAGEPTDAVIDELVPLLDEGDIVVDGGNAHFADTRRREALGECPGSWLLQRARVLRHRAGATAARGPCPGAVRQRRRPHLRPGRPARDVPHAVVAGRRGSPGALTP